ncbi:MAG: transposase [Brasilonema angustatum HA4187-MV1]|jgi:transposase|nr:transposase [Brasilonema angustatum HA4187-MV1]
MVLYIRNLERQINWILPKVNVCLFNQVLADFAREFKLGQDKHIILTLDRAGWHTSKDLEIPVGLHLEYLPAYSPELQAAERLWPLVNEPIANRSFDQLEDERGSFIPML